MLTNEDIALAARQANPEIDFVGFARAVEAKIEAKLRDENARLRAALENLVKAAPMEVSCYNMHHPKKYQHLYDETCQLVSMYAEALESAQEALKGQP